MSIRPGSALGTTCQTTVQLARWRVFGVPARALMERESERGEEMEGSRRGEGRRGEGGKGGRRGEQREGKRRRRRWKMEEGDGEEERRARVKGPGPWAMGQGHTEAPRSSSDVAGVRALTWQVTSRSAAARACIDMRRHAQTCTDMHRHAHTCTYMHRHAQTCTYMHIPRARRRPLHADGTTLARPPLPRAASRGASPPWP